MNEPKFEFPRCEKCAFYREMCDAAMSGRREGDGYCMANPPLDNQRPTRPLTMKFNYCGAFQISEGAGKSGVQYTLYPEAARKKWEADVAVERSLQIVKHDGAKNVGSVILKP